MWDPLESSQLSRVSFQVLGHTFVVGTMLELGQELGNVGLRFVIIDVPEVVVVVVVFLEVVLVAVVVVVESAVPSERRWRR